MRKRSRMFLAELEKMRHTFLIPIHLLLPIAGSILFLLYYRITNWSEEAQASGFLEIAGVVYPFIISIVCARSVELEEGNHFQTFLGLSVKKRDAFLSKWMVMQVLSLGSVAAAIILYALGSGFWLGNTALGMDFYIKVVFVMWLGSVPLYLEHLFLNLRFSRSVSIGVGAAQLLLSALMLTGLGDGRWQFFPCTWSSRGSQTVLLSYIRKDAAPFLLSEIKNWHTCGGLITVVLCVIIMIWFHFYEGRQCNE